MWSLESHLFLGFFVHWSVLYTSEIICLVIRYFRCPGPWFRYPYIRLQILTTFSATLQDGFADWNLDFFARFLSALRSFECFAEVFDFSLRFVYFVEILKNTPKFYVQLQTHFAFHLKRFAPSWSVSIEYWLFSLSHWVELWYISTFTFLNVQIISLLYGLCCCCWLKCC